MVDLFRSRAALEAEILMLKQQIIVLRRGKPNRMSFLAVDRFILGWVCRLFPKAHGALAIVRPIPGLVAPCRLPVVLALEVQAWSRPSSGAKSGPTVNPGDEHRQSVVGALAFMANCSSSDRCRADERCQVYGAQERAAVAGLETSAQRRTWDRGDGFFRRSGLSFRPLYGMLIMGHGRDRSCGWRERT